MVRKLERFREFLTDNEIFFKTATATLLSAMALIVAFAQLTTSLGQKALSELQTHIIEAQSPPQFEAAIHQQLNELTGRYDDNSLTIVNSGGPIHEFDAEAAYFLHVSGIATVPDADIRPLQPRIVSWRFDLPVNGYFATQYVSAVGKGQLVKTSGYHNNQLFGALASATRDIAKGPRWQAANVDQLVYLALRYRDLLDRPHEDYYEVPQVGGGWRMADSDGQAIFQRWRNEPKAELSDLDAQQLLARATKAIDNTIQNGPERK